MTSWCRRAGAPALLLVSMLLGGCIGGDGGEEVITPPDLPETPVIKDPDTGETLVMAPTWQVGDFWTYETTGGETELVVSGETATDWIIDTTHESTAFFNALSDISTLGTQRKIDLAGSQDPARVEFFRWPLVDGATWTTTWDGAAKAIVAKEEPNGVFSFESKHEDGTLHAKYSYDPDVRWFRTFDFYEPDGTLQWSNTLIDSGSGWTGDLVRFTAEQVFQRDNSKEMTQQGIDSSLVEFTQAPEHTHVFLSWDVVCPDGYFHFSVVPGDTATSQGYSSPGVCPKEEHVFQALDPAPGDWGITVLKSTTTETVWNAEVYVATLETVTLA